MGARFIRRMRAGANPRGCRYVRKMDDDEKIPASVCKMVRAVLLSSVKGVPLKKFCKDYFNLVGENFPWRKLGFASPVSLLKAMPSVVRFEFSQKDDDYRLYGIGDDQMFMPSWVIKAQGNISLNSPPPDITVPTQTTKPTVPRKAVENGTKKRELVYNAKGLVTVYISWCDSVTKKEVSSCDVWIMETVLCDMVSQIASPVEVSVHPNACAFVRFGSIEEAENVIRQLNKSVFRGFKFSMVPAIEKMPQGKVKPAMCSKSKKQIQDSLQEALKKKKTQRRSKPLKVNNDSSNSKKQNSAELTSKPVNNDGDFALHEPNRNHYRGVVEDLALSEYDSDDSSLFEWDESLLDNPIISIAINNYTSRVKEASNDDRGEHMVHTEYNESGLVPVTVSQAHSPDDLWLQLSVDPEQECEKLSRLIAESEPTRLNKCQIGSFCCVRNSHAGTHFMRARVENILLNSIHKQVNVLCIDSGEMKVASQGDLFSLPSAVDLQLVPPLAVPCALNGIVSTCCSGESWFPLDIQLLWKHLYRKKVYAKIVKRSSRSASLRPEKNLGLVDLYFDPTGTRNVVETLIEEGLHLDFASSAESEYDTVSEREGDMSIEIDPSDECVSPRHSRPDDSPPPSGCYCLPEASNKVKTSPWRKLKGAYGMIL